jgi:hypothetical protein
MIGNILGPINDFLLVNLRRKVAILIAVSNENGHVMNRKKSSVRSEIYLF